MTEEEIEKKIEAEVEKRVTARLKEFQNNLDLHGTKLDGSVKAGLNDIMFTVFGNALYPTQVDMTFDKGDFKELQKELNCNEDIITLETDYGPIHLHREP